MNNADIFNPESALVHTDRIMSVVMNDWSVLGCQLQFNLGRERTILTGRNAAGKSIILESIVQGAMAASFRGIISILGPAHMEFAIDLGGEQVLYSYDRRFDPDAANEGRFDADDGNDIEDGVVWNEFCIRVPTREDVWRVENGVASFPDGRSMPMPVESSLLRVSKSPAIALPPEVARIRRLLRGVTLVRAGVPRDRQFRAPVRLFKLAPNTVRAGRGRWGDADIRVRHTMATLLDWFENKRELLTSVEEILRRIGLAKTIGVHITPLSPPVDKPEHPTHEGQVNVDDVDFGCLSDGSLRVIEMVVGLVDPKVSMLLLEEPETAIHPGLLRRVLAEIEAHAAEKQIICSTHAPVVVDWASPGDIRLVERKSGCTSARSLNEHELSQLHEYLNNDLDLSDYLYSGSIE